MSDSPQPSGSIWPAEAITGAAAAMHALTCCPMDETSQCDESELPLEEARAALEFVAPAVEELIASRMRMAMRVSDMPETIEAAKTGFVVHGMSKAATDGLDSFALEHPEVFLMDGAEHLLALLRTHLQAQADLRALEVPAVEGAEDAESQAAE